jgi:hypothetical protein
MVEPSTASIVPPGTSLQIAIGTSRYLAVMTALGSTALRISVAA